MSSRTTPITDVMHEYLLGVSLRVPDILRRLLEETAELPQSNMQISPEQGQFMQLLLRLMDARRVIEVGTFTGYSSLSMMLAMPEDARLVACDISEEWTAIARRYWREAGVADRIDLRLGPASDTLAALLDNGEDGHYDFAFIDADKSGYGDYYEKCLQLVRPGGVIAVDNVLWHGKVADPKEDDEDTLAIRRFNEALHDDERIELSMVPIGDGLTLARKR